MGLGLCMWNSDGEALMWKRRDVGIPIDSGIELGLQNGVLCDTPLWHTLLAEGNVNPVVT